MVRLFELTGVVLVAIAALVVGCRATAPPEQRVGDGILATDVAEPQWTRHVQPFLAARCGTCHGGEEAAAGLDVTAWEGLVSGSDYGQALIAYDADLSLMLELGHRLPDTLPAGYEWRHATRYGAFREVHRLDDREIGLLRRWIEQGARNDRGEAPFEDSSGRVFVAVQDAGMVAIIDVDHLVVARTARFDEFGGRAARPHDTDYEPDGSAFYVTLIGAQRVAKVEPSRGEVVGTLDVAAINPTYRPGMLALDPHSNRLYLSRSISDLSGGRSIMFVDRETLSAEEVLVPYPRPHPIGLTRDGRYVLSGSLSDNLVTAINTESLDLAAPLRVDGTQTPLMHYDVAPDGRTAAVTGQFSNLVYILDITDPENLTVLHAVPVGQEPWYPAYSADGSQVIVPNHRSNDVSIVDVEQGVLVHTITHPRFAMPHGAAASHDGRYIFVSNSNLTHEVGHSPGVHGVGADVPEIRYQPRYPLDRSGDGRADNLQTGHVAVIDAASFEVIKILELEEFPSGMSLWQEGYPHR